MLAALSIRDIVLIDRLDLEFASGLSVLTGEAGAGKSILLDAFALALGARGDAALVRHGAEQGQVTAAFELPANHPVRALMDENDIPAEDELILRRVQFADGRTRAFVNDQPLSDQALKTLGAALVERSEEHTSELQSQSNLVCRLLLEKKKTHLNASFPPTSGPSSTGISPTATSTSIGGCATHSLFDNISHENISPRLTRLLFVCPAAA